jgi:ubiquinone/menaquinone biosynthesis C-methylase UbiE
MTAYTRKFYYQDKKVAEEYAHKRFSYPEGKEEYEATKQALSHALESIPDAEKILDAPCGSGRFTEFFHENGYSYFGSDISMEMIELLAKEQKCWKGAPPLVRCDAEHLPFKNNVFDCVTTIRFLNHNIPSAVREKILKEMRRVSKKWLIVMAHRLKRMGPFVWLKIFIRELFGGDVSKYRIRQEILRAGWKEESRIWIKNVKRYANGYIGVYQKI